MAHRGPGRSIRGRARPCQSRPSFSSGVAKDETVVRAPQTQGQITRLKIVRRQMYGRGKIDLLQARLIGAQ
jgi:hypothetical protein